MTVSIRMYVVDTGYILELFRVGTQFSEEGHRKVVDKFKMAITSKSRLYVPLPVLFEVANHIAGVSDFPNRRRLVNEFLATVSDSVQKSNPWIITPPGDPDSIQELMNALGYSVNRFATEFAEQEISLTDTIVIMEAERLKDAYPSTTLKQYFVHIWTTDSGVKTREPDTEPNPFP